MIKIEFTLKQNKEYASVKLINSMMLTKDINIPINIIHKLYNDIITNLY